MNNETPQNGADTKSQETFSTEAEKTRTDMMIVLDAYINSHHLPEDGREELRGKLLDLNVKLEDVFREIEELSKK